MDLYYTFIIKTSILCAVTVDGKHLGECRDRPMAVRAKKKQSYLIKAVFYADTGKRYKDISAIFCPEGGTGFEGADVIRFSPHTFLLQLYALPEQNTGVFEPIKQVMFEQAGLQHIATLYTDGISFIKLESSDSIAKVRLAGIEGEITLNTLQIGQHNLLTVMGKTAKTDLMYALGYDGEDYTVTSLDSAEKAFVEDGLLIVTGSLYTMRRHTLKKQFIYNGKALVQSGLTQSAPQKPMPSHVQLLPYAFLEAVMANSTEEALGMLDNAQYGDTEFVQLQNYFGEILSVVQNPYDRNLHSYVGAVYSAAPGYFEVNYYSFDIAEGKIQNITKI